MQYIDVPTVNMENKWFFHSSLSAALEFLDVSRALTVYRAFQTSTLSLQPSLTPSTLLWKCHSVKRSRRATSCLRQARFPFGLP